MRLRQALLGLVALHLKMPDACCILKQTAPFLSPRRQRLIHQTLTNNCIRIVPNACL